MYLPIISLLLINFLKTTKLTLASNIVTNATLCEFQNAQECQEDTKIDLSQTKRFYLENILNREVPFSHYMRDSEPGFYVVFIDHKYRDFKKSCGKDPFVGPMSKARKNNGKSKEKDDKKAKINEIEETMVEFCFCENDFEMSKTNAALPVYNIYREFLPSFASIEDIKNFEPSPDSSIRTWAEMTRQGTDKFSIFPNNINCYTDKARKDCIDTSVEFRKMREKSFLLTNSTTLFYNLEFDKKAHKNTENSGRVNIDFQNLLLELLKFDQENQDDRRDLPFSWDSEIQRICLFDNQELYGETAAELGLSMTDASGHPINAASSTFNNAGSTNFVNYGKLVRDYKINCLVRQANLKMELLKEIFELKHPCCPYSLIAGTKFEQLLAKYYSFLGLCKFGCTFNEYHLGQKQHSEHIDHTDLKNNIMTGLNYFHDKWYRTTLLNKLLSPGADNCNYNKTKICMSDNSDCPIEVHATLEFMKKSSNYKERVMCDLGGRLSDKDFERILKDYDSSMGLDEDFSHKSKPRINLENESAKGEDDFNPLGQAIKDENNKKSMKNTITSYDIFHREITSPDTNKALHLIRSLIKKALLRPCTGRAYSPKQNTKYLCSNAKHRITKDSLDYPFFSWETGLDPTFNYDVYWDRSTQVDESICIDLSDYNIAQHVPPFSYSDGSPEVYIPKVVLRTKTFESKYVASSFKTATNPETRIFCPKCSCNSAGQSFPNNHMWQKADNPELVCNRTIQHYWYGWDHQKQLEKVHPLEWPTCHWFNMEIQTNSQEAKDFCSKVQRNLAANTIGMKCLMLNFPQTDQIYDLMEFKNGYKLYNVEMVADIIYTESNTDGIANVLPINFEILDRQEIHGVDKFQSYIRGHGGYGGHNNSQHGIDIDLSIAIENTQFENKNDFEQRTFFKKRKPDLSVDPNADLFVVLTNTEKIESPSKDYLENSYLGMGWFIYNWAEKRFWIKGSTSQELGSKEPLVEVIQSYLRQARSNGFSPPNTGTGFSGPGSIVYNKDSNAYNRMCPDSQQGNLQPSTDLYLALQSPKRSNEIFNKINKASFYEIPQINEYRSMNFQKREALKREFMAYNEYLYAPIPPTSREAEIRPERLEKTKWSHTVTPEGRHEISRKSIENYNLLDVNLRARVNPPTFNKFRMHFSMTDTEVFGHMARPRRKKSGGATTPRISALDDARILAVRRILDLGTNNTIGNGMVKAFQNNLRNTGGGVSPNPTGTDTISLSCLLLTDPNTRSFGPEGTACNPSTAPISSFSGFGAGNHHTSGTLTNNIPQEKTVVVLGVYNPRGHIIGRVDWINDNGKFISQWQFLAFKHCRLSDFLPGTTVSKQRCFSDIIRREFGYSPHNSQVPGSQANPGNPGSTTTDPVYENHVKTLLAMASKPINKVFYWSANENVRTYMKTYAERAQCHMDSITHGWSNSFLEGLLNNWGTESDAPILNNPFFSSYSRAKEDRAAILFIPTMDGFCNHGYGKIRVLVKALGLRTKIRYFNCKDLDKKQTAIKNAVLQPFQVDWRPATKRQALYPGCCDVCYIWDHFKPCAFQCPDAYIATIMTVLLSSLFLAAIVYFFMYICFAVVENKRSGVPNWWCALPCFRLTVEEYTIEREILEESEYDEEDEYQDRMGQNYQEKF